MKRLVRFAAALTAVLSLTACTAEVGTGTVTSNLLPCVTAEPEKEEDTTMLDKDIIKSTITSTDDGNGNYTNPVIFADVPDIDIIRVDDAFLYGFDDHAPVSGVPHNEILRPCKLGNSKLRF